MNIEEIKQLQREYQKNVYDLINQLHSLTSNNAANNEFIEKINILTSEINSLRYQWYEQSRDIIGRMFEILVNDEYHYGDVTVMIVVDSPEPKHVDVYINLFKPFKVMLCKSNWVINDDEDEVLEEIQTNDLVVAVHQIIAFGGLLLEKK